MKNPKNRKPLEAALTDAKISIEDLRTAIAQKAADVDTFQPEEGNSFGNPWVRDIVAPGHEVGETWCAIISAPDGKTYEVDFTIDGSTVTLVGDPRAVTTSTEYTPAEAAQPRKTDGTFHGAAAASKDAYTASANAETKDDHAKAADLHDKAANLHKADGNAAMAKQHKEKAKAHTEQAAALTASAPGDISPTEPSGRMPEARYPLESASMVEAPTTKTAWDCFMAMAGGVRTVTLGCNGFPLTVTLIVNPAGASALQAQLEAVSKNSKQRVFNCFDHGGSKGKTEASSWPKKFFWKDGVKPGIYEAAEPSDTGAAAISGKRYRGFSLTFFTNAEIKPLPKIKGPGFHIEAGAKGSPENPAQIICPEDVEENPEQYLNMGTLTNKPAVTANEPLFASQPNNLPPTSAAARNAGTTFRTNKNQNIMVKNENDIAALTARNEQLEQKLAELTAADLAENKAEIRALNAELEANQANLQLAKSEEKIILLEASQKKRLEKEADAAVETMVNNGAIPPLDKELKASYREKFIADPTLIPLCAAMRGSLPNARQQANGTALTAATPRFGHGDIREGALNILRSVAQCCTMQKPIQGLDAASCQKRNGIAKEIAMIYRNEIRGKHMELDAQGQPRPSINPDFLMAPLEAAADTDTLGTLAGTLVSQRYLDIFMYKLPMIANGKIMTDFSDQPSDLNQTVSTRKIVVPGVMSYDPTLDADGYPKGWVPATPAQTTDVNITMDELIGAPIQYDLAALSSTQRQLFAEQAPAAAYANALYFLKKIFAVCTAANFNSYAAVTAADANGIVKVPVAYATYAVAAIDFARGKISEIAAAFDANEVPDEDRTLLLNAQYYNKATTDPSIVTFFAGQQAPEIVTQGSLPDLGGFAPIKAPNFPGTNNRVGMALQKNGLLVKSRLPANLNTIQNGAGNGTVTQIVHPETGVAMMVIMWTDHKRGYSAWLPCAILGAAKGDGRGGLVLTNQ